MALCTELAYNLGQHRSLDLQRIDLNLKITRTGWSLHKHRIDNVEATKRGLSPRGYPGVLISFTEADQQCLKSGDKVSKSRIHFSHSLTAYLQFGMLPKSHMQGQRPQL